VSVLESGRHDTASVRAHYAALAAEYDDRANAACKRAYEALVRRHLGQARRVLEIGAGSSPLLGTLDAPLKIALDLSREMLTARHAAGTAARVVADAQALPLAPASFEAVYSVNVLEHVPDPGAVAREGARVLAPGGLFLAVTPNGDAEWLLDLLEVLRLKLPEGPHRFLGGPACRELAGTEFEVVAHKKWLAFPAGPGWLVNTIDRALGNRGLFQYVLLQRRA
jgi:SAM-dependent methyltransferase